MELNEVKKHFVKEADMGKIGKRLLELRAEANLSHMPIARANMTYDLCYNLSNQKKYRDAEYEEDAPKKSTKKQKN